MGKWRNALCGNWTVMTLPLLRLTVGRWRPFSFSAACYPPLLPSPAPGQEDSGEGNSTATTVKQFPYKTNEKRNEIQANCDVTYPLFVIYRHRPYRSKIYLGPNLFGSQRQQEHRALHFKVPVSGVYLRGKNDVATCTIARLHVFFCGEIRGIRRKRPFHRFSRVRGVAQVPAFFYAAAKEGDRLGGREDWEGQIRSSVLGDTHSPTVCYSGARSNEFLCKLKITSFLRISFEYVALRKISRPR